jgi:hypothetical protein
MKTKGMCAISTYSVEARGFFCTSNTTTHVFENTHADMKTKGMCAMCRLWVSCMCALCAGLKSVHLVGFPWIRPSISSSSRTDISSIPSSIYLKLKTCQLRRWSTNLWSRWGKGKRWLSHTCTDNEASPEAGRTVYFVTIPVVTDTRMATKVKHLHLCDISTAL